MRLLSSHRTDSQVDIAILVLRLALGTVFIAHGGQKLFVYGFDGVAGAMTQMGIPMPGVMGPFVSLLEFFGGIALVVGLLTRLAALGLAADMLVATLVVHLKNGFFMPGGVEFTMALLAGCIALVLAGAGRISADGVFSRRGTRPSGFARAP